MAFTTSVTINVDAVTDETIANATGPVLFKLGKLLFDEALRLYDHVEQAEAALAEAHREPQDTLDTLGAEVAAARERYQRLEPLAMKAWRKFCDEAMSYFGRRRSPPAIDFLSCDEWEVLSTAASAFDVDYWSSFEAETESASLSSEARVLDQGNSSFDLLDFADDDTIDGSSSTASAAGHRRSSTPTPTTLSSSSVKAQPHEFGPSPQPRAQPTSTAQRQHQDPWGGQPAPTPWDLPAPTPSTTSGATASSSSVSRAYAPPSSADAATLSAPTPPPALANAEFAAAVYDFLTYDNRIYGYVAGHPVPVVPRDFAVFGIDQLRAIRNEAERRLKEANVVLGRAQFRRLSLVDPGSTDSLMDVVTEISELEAVVEEAVRLGRALAYEWMHRWDGIAEEREAQRHLIEAEELRLQACGAPIYWSQADQDEARRVQRANGGFGFAIWHPAAASLPEPARTSRPSRASSSSSTEPAPTSRRPRAPSRARSRSRAACATASALPQSRPQSPSEENPWVPRDDTEHAHHQLRERLHRQVLQRQGDYDIPPSHVVHAAPFDAHVDDAGLKQLMLRHGFDVDEATRVVEYYVTSTRKGRDVHYYGFVTFRHLAAAERCVRELDPMGMDGHRGMTPIRRRNDGSYGHVKLTFSFSTNPRINANALRQLDAGSRTSSRAPPARRQPRAATPARRQRSRARPADVTDSDETDNEWH
ncbi:hypothetical protein AAVH_22180 [Aphelenchoides avenae]|nr:hypothetical protein AAVH_22180 [Aphelenchus avenae]